MSEIDINDYAVSPSEKGELAQAKSVRDSQIKILAAHHNKTTKAVYLVGKMPRKDVKLRQCAVPIPPALSERFNAAIAGAVGVGIAVLAEMMLTQIEKSGQPITIDAETWLKITSDTGSFIEEDLPEHEDRDEAEG